MKANDSISLSLPNLGAETPFLRACELVLKKEFGALPDVIGRNEDGVSEICYLYDPGNRGSSPLFLPKSGEWRVQDGKIWLRMAENRILRAQFEDDFLLAWRISLQQPEALSEVIHFLECATMENLSLQGTIETRFEDWFQSLAIMDRKDFLENKVFSNLLDSVPALFHPDLPPHTPFSLLTENMDACPTRLLVARRQPDASLLATFDLLGSKRGQALLACLRKGPREFAAKSRAILAGAHRAMTPFLQTKQAIENRFRSISRKPGKKI